MWEAVLLDLVVSQRFCPQMCSLQTSPVQHKGTCRRAIFSDRCLITGLPERWNLRGAPQPAFKSRFVGKSERWLRRRLEQRIKLLGPLFVAKVETERSQASTIGNLTAYFSTLSKVISVVGYYHMRSKGMTAYFAVSVFIVTSARVVFVHGMTPDFNTGCSSTPD